MSTETAERLWQAITERAGGRRKVFLPALLEALHAALPDTVGSPAARARLIQLLEVLAEEQRLDLPRTSRSWDATQHPRVPRWILLSADAPAASTPDHRTIPWAPELSFVARQPRVSDLDALLAIQRFLAEGGRERPMVPSRERSVELFGDEKRLDALSRSVLFGSERLSLEILRCFNLSPPLVWESCAGGRDRPVLVIENHHSWHSFCRWNREAGRYAAVVYGAGAHILGSVAFLAQVVSESQAASEVRYFGDLDPQGLDIPAKTAAKCADAGLPPVRPALEWYQLLLEGGAGRAGPLKGRQPTLERGLDWLGPLLRETVGALFAERKRLAQEWVGWEQLCDHLHPGGSGRSHLIAEDLQ